MDDCIVMDALIVRIRDARRTHHHFAVQGMLESADMWETIYEAHKAILHDLLMKHGDTSIMDLIYQLDREWDERG